MDQGEGPVQICPNGLTAEEIRGMVGDSPLMLEVGSHEGTDTARFLEAMPGAIIHCFDPEERANEVFRDTVGRDPRVRLYEVAVADIDGLRRFYASTGRAGSRADWTFSGSVKRPTGHLARSPEIKFKPPVNIPCVRLDTWLNAHPDITCIDFAWVDIQGAQVEFIAGATRGLSITRYLYIECHRVPQYEGEPTRDELVAMLPEFKPLGVYGDENILFRNGRTA